jgi:hypothetical protein
MKDEVIIKIVEEMCSILRSVDGNVACEMPCGTMAPSYNAALQAAKASHPNDVFLSMLTPFTLSGGRGPVVEGGDPTALEMRALFTQLRIAIESLQGERPAPGRAEPQF